MQWEPAIRLALLFRKMRSSADWKVPMSSLFRVGVVTTAHGIKGAVKVYPTTEDPRRFLDLEKISFSRTGEEEDICCQYTIENVQFIKNLVILSLKEVKDRNLAEAMKGGSFWISDEEAIPLEKDEFYIRDFMEATVKDEDGNLIGQVEDIMETGSNNVLLVRAANGRELLIPVIYDCIVNMDSQKAEITVHMLKGLGE